MTVKRSFCVKELFSENTQALRKYIASIVLKLEIADELAQETFVRLQASTRGDLESPRAFLFRTAHNLALDHIRRGRRVSIDELDDRIFVSLADEAPSPEEQVAAREELAIMRAIILELPPKCRQVFLLVRLEGLSQRDVASEMSISQTMVRKYLARAVDHIHRRLGPNGR